MAIEIDLFGSRRRADERQDQRALDLAQRQREQARGADVTALTGLLGEADVGVGPPLPPFAEQSPERQIQSLADQGQATPFAQAQFTAEQAANAPLSEQEQATLDVTQQTLANRILDNTKIQLGIDNQNMVNRNLKQFGGLTAEQHGDNMRTIGEFGIGLNNVQDIRTLNSQFGREVLPGSVAGKYKALRTITFNTLRLLTDAGALQAPDIELFENLLPDFGTFSSLSSDQREAQLSELQRQITLRTQTWVDTTANSVMPQITGRSVIEILGEQPAPEGATEVIEPSIGAETLERLDPFNAVPEGTFPAIAERARQFLPGR